jgi:hypothetical protein
VVIKQDKLITKAFLPPSEESYIRRLVLNVSNKISKEADLTHVKYEQDRKRERERQSKLWGVVTNTAFRRGEEETNYARLCDFPGRAYSS